MARTVLMLYATFMPLILAAAANMAFLKSGLFQGLAVPVSERLFGSHKTWRGVFGYTAFGALAGLLWAFFLSETGHLDLDYIYTGRTAGAPTGAVSGALTGALYAAGELPNSFLKRRLGMAPGESRGLFLVFDQVDSLFAAGLGVCLFYPLGAGRYFLFIILGGFTHAGVNVLLRLFRLRDTWI